jgi:O-antigen ligase
MTRNKKFSSSKILFTPFGHLVMGVAFITLFVQTQAYDPFNTPKFSALLVISSLIVMKLFTLTEYKFLMKSKINLFFKGILVTFILSGIISVLSSDNFFIATVGDTQRRNGFLSYLALAIICLAAYELVNFKNSLIIFRVTIATGVIFSFYGLLQTSGRDFIDWNNPGNAVIGTAGNPNFASALMALFAVTSITSLCVFTKSRFMQGISIACLIMCLIAIIGSDSLQGLVSISIGILFFVSVYVYSNYKKVGLLLIALSAIVMIFAVAGMLQKGPLTQILYKPSVSVRGYYWEAAIEMLKTHPFTGIGFDHYGYYFKEMRDPRYPLEFGFNLTSTNAHNTFLQMFANGGVLLGSSYLALVVFTLFVGMKLIRNSSSTNRLTAISILTIWIVFQSQSLISIDNIAISVWGWLLTGVIFGLYCESIPLNEKAQSPKLKIKLQQPASLFSITAFVLLVVPSIVLAVLLLRVENSLLKVSNYLINYASQSDKNTVIARQLINGLDQNATIVLNSPFVDPNYKLQVSYNIFDVGDQAKALEIIKGVSIEFPRNIYAVKALGQLLSIDQVNEKIEARKQLSLLDPWNADNYLQLLYMYKSTGDLMNAKLMRDKILSFAPSTKESNAAIEELLK